MVTRPALHETPLSTVALGPQRALIGCMPDCMILQALNTVEYPAQGLAELVSDQEQDGHVHHCSSAVTGTASGCANRVSAAQRELHRAVQRRAAARDTFDGTVQAVTADGLANASWAAPHTDLQPAAPDVYYKQGATTC